MTRTGSDVKYGKANRRAPPVPKGRASREYEIRIFPYVAPNACSICSPKCPVHNTSEENPVVDN
jgi:hypothetical protein